MTLEESLRPPTFRTSEIKVPVVQHPMPAPSPVSISPSAYLVCTVPAIASNPDKLRQFYQSGIPQYRVIPPPSLF